MQGAKFHVTYASNNTGSGEINDLGTYYTGENGQFQLTGLRDGWYKISELEPPTGYSIKEATQEVYIKSGTSKTLTLKIFPSPHWWCGSTTASPAKQLATPYSK